MRIALAAIIGTVVYFVYGGIIFGALPLLRDEYAKFPLLFRTKESMMPLFPIGIAATFVGILVLASGYSVATISGLKFGALIGVFAVCGFVMHNYVNLNIGLKLTIYQGVAYFIEWMLVGISIGLVYRRNG